jgi:hypothetical protein
VSKCGPAARHPGESKENDMQYAMFIYETPERENDVYIGAWR